MPDVGVDKKDHQEILSYEEMIRVVEAAALEGVEKVRLTGGEPLVRRGMIDFIQRLSFLPERLDLRLTTNGVLLAPKAERLVAVGLKKVNISLDTLDRAKYRLITGRDELDNVLAGIHAALDAGFEKVKINTVVIRGVNDDEMADLADLARRFPVDVRFIEFMPLGELSYWSKDKLVPLAEMIERLEAVGPLTPCDRTDGDGPAQTCRVPGFQGKIGFISPLTQHFCGNCNRLRLTSDGKLRLCLLSDVEVDLKKPLRAGADLDRIRSILRRAAVHKPAAHFLAQDDHAAGGRSMNLIGG
jgi:cyclic pyranopterin phosphate synthase